MQTFHLQDRVFKVTAGPSSFQFPNQLKLEMKLSPGEAFGTSQGPSRLVLAPRDTTGETHFLYNANTGRILAAYNPSLQPFDVQLTSADEKFALRGDILTYESNCENFASLNHALRMFSHIFILFINVGFADPPTVDNIKGVLGKTEFVWEHKMTGVQFELKDSDSLAFSVEESFRMMEVKDLRLLAALHYFYIACRLHVSGNSPWEFMSEIILNLCKCLQALFGESMDKVRDGLRKMGYEEDEIEGDFVPIMVLRSSFNVGHVQISLPESDKLQVLYRYLILSEMNIRKLLREVISKVRSGELVLSERKDLALDAESQKKFDRLIEKIKPRVHEEPLQQE